MDYLKLISIQHLKKEIQIRLMYIPREFDSYHFPKQNLLALKNYKMTNFYKLHRNRLRKSKDYSIVLNQQDYQMMENASLLENSLLVYSIDHHVRIYNIDNLAEFKIFECQLPKHISICRQIQNNNIIITPLYSTRNIIFIYQMRNFKKSNSLTSKSRIEQVKQTGYIIQAVANKCLYLYNAKMKKQIRRLNGFEEKKPHFNSNYIIIPFYEQFGQKWIQTYLNIYDISSMKVKGVIKTRQLSEQSEQSYESSLFIQNLNVIAILYANKLDLFEMNSLKYIGSEQIPHYGYYQIMNYDQENGLIIFIKGRFE